MPTSKFSLLGLLKPFILITVIVCSLFFMSSCGNSEVKPLVTSDNCFTLSRSQISSNMLAGSWSVPASGDFIPYIYFLPAKGTSGISITADPSDKNNILYPGRKVSLNIPGTTDPPCAFPAGLQIVQNRYDFSSENFADAKGKLIQFDFIRLVPRACTDSGYTDVMVFDVYAVTNTGGVETAVAKGYTKPCPPFCPDH